MKDHTVNDDNSWHGEDDVDIGHEEKAEEEEYQAREEEDEEQEKHRWLLLRKVKKYRR